LYEGNTWIYDGKRIEGKGIEGWVERILDNRLEPTYMSEKTEEMVYNSKKINGE
jgi:hypothetical protein